MQPSLKLRIVHVGRPGVACCRFPIARNETQIGFRHRRVIACGGFRVGVGERVELGFTEGENVRDIAGCAVADLNTDRVGQHEVREPRCRLHRDFGGDPGADRYADNDGVGEIQLVQKVQIEIGEVIDRGEGAWLLGAAEARMARRDDAHALRQPVEHRGLWVETDAGMQEEQGPPAPLFRIFYRNTIDGKSSQRILYRHHLNLPCNFYVIPLLYYGKFATPMKIPRRVATLPAIRPEVVRVRNRAEIRTT